jgi:hypothetical protein
MKNFGTFLAASCLGVALTVAPSAAAQNNQNQQQQTQPAPGTADQQQQQPGAQQQQQQQLPRTASPMPLVGLAGMLSLAAAGVARKLRKPAA